jgi:hypothetical protein
MRLMRLDEPVRARAGSAIASSRDAEITLLGRRAADGRAFSTGQLSVWIYALCDADRQPRYVGKANDPSERLKSHLRDKTRSRKVAWLRELKSRGLRPVLVLLQEVPVTADWETAERRWISRFRKRGIALLNVSRGGGGAPGASADTSERISRSVQERWADPAQAAAMLSGWRAREERLHRERYGDVEAQLKAELRRLKAKARALGIGEAT